MSGTFTIKLLGNGQLAAAEANLYLVPASTTAIIKAIKIVNTNTVAETVNIFVKKAAGTSRLIMPKDMSLAVGYEVEDDSVLTLGVGDAIRGYSTTANKVDYSIHGVEET